MNATMKLTATGTIKVEGYSVRRTTEGDWHVSRFETSIGYVDSLAEVDSLIARHKEKVRARLEMAQRKAEERKVADIALKTGLSENMVRAHNITGEGDPAPCLTLRTHPSWIGEG